MSKLRRLCDPSSPTKDEQQLGTGQKRAKWDSENNS